MSASGFSSAFRITGVMSPSRSEEHTSELQSPCNLVCRLLLEKKKKREGKSLRNITGLNQSHHENTSATLVFRRTTHDRPSHAHVASRDPTRHLQLLHRNS